MNVGKARQTAIHILDEFEELLDEKGVTVPSSDREGREEEARLYGSEYYSLEDAITAILVNPPTSGAGSGPAPGSCRGRSRGARAPRCRSAE